MSTFSICCACCVYVKGKHECLENWLKWLEKGYMYAEGKHWLWEHKQHLLSETIKDQTLCNICGEWVTLCHFLLDIGGVELLGWCCSYIEGHEDDWHSCYGHHLHWFHALMVGYGHDDWHSCYGHCLPCFMPYCFHKIIMIEIVAMVTACLVSCLIASIRSWWLR